MIWELVLSPLEVRSYEKVSNEDKKKSAYGSKRDVGDSHVVR